MLGCGTSAHNLGGVLPSKPFWNSPSFPSSSSVSPPSKKKCRLHGAAVGESAAATSAGGAWAQDDGVGGFILVWGEGQGRPPGFSRLRTGESGRSSQGDGDGEEDPESKQSIKQILFDNVLRNPFIWGMAFTYFFVYVIRQGVTSWFVFYLLQEKGATDAGIAAQRVSGLELGGLVGSLLAGRLSDLYIARSKGKVRLPRLARKEPKPSAPSLFLTRTHCLSLYEGGCGQAGPGRDYLHHRGGLMLLALEVPLVDCRPVALHLHDRFLPLRPQMLIRLCGTELVRPASVGASEGFLGWIAYLGAANAGVPLSIIVRDYGWNAYFTTLLAACAGALLLLAPMTNLKSFTQRKEAKKLK